MKAFECNHRFCSLFRNCPNKNCVAAVLHSNPDEAGMPIYFGVCSVINKTFSEIPHERVVDVQEEGTASSVSSMGEHVTVRLDEEQEKRILEAVNAPKVIDGFTQNGADEQAAIIKKAIKKKRDGKNKAGEKITQTQVAKDFGVSRQTVIRWEKEETDNGPDNESNEWGYYADLRKKAHLRGAYMMLADNVKKYNKYIEVCRKDNKPPVTFAQYNEAWIKHNPNKVM